MTSEGPEQEMNPASLSVEGLEELLEINSRVCVYVNEGITRVKAPRPALSIEAFSRNDGGHLG